MLFKRFDQAKPFVTLGIVVLVWLIVPAVIKGFMRTTFFELTAPISAATSRARDLQQYWGLRMHSNHELIEAGFELARLNAAYEFSVQQTEDLKGQLARFETLLRMPPVQKYRYEHARVARRDFSGWWQRLVIRKGSNFGILKDSPVVFSGGVVGRVAEVHAATAVVDMISSPTFRLASTVEGDSAMIVFQGGVNVTLAPPSGIVESVPLDITVTAKSPKRLVTSGYGGVFPAGLTLGTITRLEMSSDGLFQTGEVKLDERLGAIDEVTVLVPLSQN